MFHSENHPLPNTQLGQIKIEGYSVFAHDIIEDNEVVRTVEEVSFNVEYKGESEIIDIKIETFLGWVQKNCVTINGGTIPSHRKEYCEELIAEVHAHFDLWRENLNFAQMAWYDATFENNFED